MRNYKLIGSISAALLLLGAVLFYYHNYSLKQQASSDVAIMQLPHSHLIRKTSFGQQLTDFLLSDGRSTAKLERNLGQVLGANTTDSLPLSQEQIWDLYNPGVQRVINQVKGTVEVPDFDIDLMDFTLLPRKEVYESPVDVTATGSSFFVNNQGYLITNAHVASESIANEDLEAKIADYWLYIFEAEVNSLTPAQKQQYKQQIVAAYGEDYDTMVAKFTDLIPIKIDDYIKNNTKPNLEQKLVVLDPTLKGLSVKTTADLQDLIAKSFPATIVSINEDYATDHKDVALIKIEQSNVPVLPLATAGSVNTGEKIYVLGFPGNAELDGGDLFNSTITTGSIGSIKEIDGEKLYQTDAKISRGSSGGPILNGEGKVIGIITYLTANNDDGDGFGFAMPIDLALPVLADAAISNDPGVFAENFLAGMVLQQQSLCRKANASYELAKAGNAAFVPSGYLDKYTNECDKVIADGKSLDSTLDRAKNYVEHVNIYLAAGAAAGILLLFGSVVIILRMRKKIAQGHNPGATLTPIPGKAV